MQKRILLTVSFILSTSLPFFAQISVNPHNDFYSDALGWHLKGYVRQLPQLKPYPAAVIQNILEEVAACEDEAEAARAESYRSSYFLKRWHAGVNAAADMKLNKIENPANGGARRYDFKPLFYGEAIAAGDEVFSDCFSLGYDASLSVLNNTVPASAVEPLLGAGAPHPFIKQHSLQAGSVDFTADGTAAVHVGNATVYGTFGRNQYGYGLFGDNDIILNSYAHPFLNGSFHYNGAHFQYTQLFGLLAARSYAYADRFKAAKFFAFHSVEIPIFTPKVTVSLYESVVWGKHFTPSYVIPAPWFIIANVAGFNENILSGIQFKLHPLNGLALTASAVFDDLDLKQFAKFKLENAAVRTAFKTGFLYAPQHSPCSLIGLDYTLITPYAYTKYNTLSRTVNYLDYTHFGESVGTRLPPNSDRVCFTMDFKPMRGLLVSTQTAFARHGNAYESLDEEEADRLWKSGAFKKSAGDGVNADTLGAESARDKTAFLKQQHIMYLIQAALSLKYEFPRAGIARAEISGSYTFEYIKQDGVNSAIYPANGGFADAAAARAAWANALHDSYNHYLSCGIKIMF